MKRASVLAAVAAALLACGPSPTPGGDAKAPAGGPAAACPPRPVAAPDASPGKLDAVVGKRVAKMCLYGVEGDVRVAAQNALRTKEGDKLDQDRIREDIGALVKLGTIDDAVVSALPAGDDVVVLYQLRARPRIAEVLFEGANVFEKEGLTGKIALEKHRPLMLGEVHDLVAAMREEYARRGYRGAKVEAKMEPAGPDLVRLRFVVSEGPQWKLGKVAIKGATKVPEAELKKAAQLEEGTPFDDEKLERAVLNIGAVYLDRGMITARVDRNVGEPDKDGKAPVTFEVQEGDVFRIGKLSLGKLAAADEKNLLAKLKSKPNKVFSRSQMIEDVKTLTETFAARGQKVDVLPRTELDPKKKIVDVVLDVEAAAAQ